MSLLNTAIAVFLPTASAAALAGVTGITGRLRAWLEARGHAQVSQVLADASTRVQAAMQNAAGQIALEAQQGTLDIKDVSALHARLMDLSKGVMVKLPDSVAALKPAAGAIYEGIRGKITAALPVPDPVAAPAAAVPAMAASSVIVSETVRPDRRAFFDAVRGPVFGGRMVHNQVEGCERILDHWNETVPSGDPRQLAYILATTFWETGRSMQPVEEVGRGKDRFYGSTRFYGRGLVQLTLESNYRKMSPIAGCDLVAHPERALEWPIALKVLFAGMLQGLFTGRRLGDYFDAAVDDPVAARSIVNGRDRAEEIAALHRSFLAAFSAVGATEQAVAA